MDGLTSCSSALAPRRRDVGHDDGQLHVPGESVMPYISSGILSYDMGHTFAMRLGGQAGLGVTVTNYCCTQPVSIRQPYTAMSNASLRT